MSKNVIIEKDHKIFNWIILKSATKVYSYKKILDRVKERSTLQCCEIPDDYMTVRNLLYSEHQSAVECEKVLEDLVSQKDRKPYHDLGGETYARFLFRRRMLQKMSPIYYSFKFANKVIKENNLTGPVTFIPSRFSYRIYSVMIKRQLLDHNNIYIPRIILLKFYIMELLIQIYFFFINIIYPEILFFKMSGKKNDREKKYFPIGVHLYKGVMFNGKHCYNVDFFIDEVKIKKDDVLFVLGPHQPHDFIKHTKESGYHYVDIYDDIISKYNRYYYLKKHYRKISTFRFKSIRSILRQSWFSTSASSALRNFISWRIFFDKYNVKKFMNMMNPQEITREIMIREYGAESIFVHDSVSVTYVDKGKNSQYAEMLYVSNMIFDKTVTDIETNKWLRSSRNSVKKYIDNGVLFADYAKNITSEQKTAIRTQLGVLPEQSLVSFFDNSVGPKCVFNYEEYYLLFDSIKKILDLYPHFYVAFKSKHSYESTLRKQFPFYIKDIFRELLQNERFCEVTNDQGIMNYELVGSTDLVIAGATSTMTFISLAGGIKTISYDPGNKYFQKFIITENFPNLCAHNFNELVDLIEYWLYKSTDDDFRTFINDYIRPNIDPYCDGRAIERFQEILLA
jgi:hypothetical protein